MYARVMQPARLILVCAGMILAGCKSGGPGEGPALFFPPPPVPPRVQFLTWASGADQVEPAKGSFATFILGQEAVVQRAINKPYGVAVRDGVAYVCDTKGLCICRLDFKNQTYGVLGVSGPGKLRKPINIIIDPLGYKFVVDPERKQVVVYGPDDKYTTAFDVPPPCRPVDVAVYENELFVLDNDDTPQVVVFDRVSGDIKRTFGSAGGEPGQFKIPNSLAISPDGYLYVSDTHNWRVQKLTRAGESVWVKGTPGYTLGSFGRPRGIRVGPDGLVYVVDGSTEIVQMYDPDGQILMRFGGPGDVPGALGLPSSLAIDKSSLPYFERYVHKDFKVDYLLFVVSQYGTRLINVYAFGSFPAGYRLAESEIATLPTRPVEEGIGPVPSTAPSVSPGKADDAPEMQAPQRSPGSE